MTLIRCDNAAEAEAAGLPAHVIAAIAPLLESLKMLNRQTSEAEAELEKIVKNAHQNPGSWD